MMAHAAMWDRFLSYVGKTQEDWASPENDTDSYREGRALQYFNLGAAHLVCSLHY